MLWSALQATQLIDVDKEVATGLKQEKIDTSAEYPTSTSQVGETEDQFKDLDG